MSPDIAGLHGEAMVSRSNNILGRPTRFVVLKLDLFISMVNQSTHQNEETLKIQRYTPWVCLAILAVTSEM